MAKFTIGLDYGYEIVDCPISAEVIATDFENMIQEGEILAELNPNIVDKVPMIEDSIKAIRYFSEKGIRTSCTLVFSMGQALLAAKAGATYISPFIRRLDDISVDGTDLIQQIWYQQASFSVGFSHISL